MNKIVNSKWINTDDCLKSPTDEYFTDFKLNLWIKYCEILNESHDRVAELILNGYMNDFNQLAIKKIVGKYKIIVILRHLIIFQIFYVKKRICNV